MQHHFPIVSREPTTKLKLVAFDFAAPYKSNDFSPEAIQAHLESRTLRIFRYRYKLPLSHKGEHSCFCTVYYCPYHA